LNDFICPYKNFIDFQIKQKCSKEFFGKSESRRTSEKEKTTAKTRGEKNYR
jgi:hypothetical protein